MTPLKNTLKKRVLIVVGTRPEAIKLVPLILAFNESKKVEPIIVSTGQHSAMVNDVLAPADLVPDVDLHAAAPGNSLNTLFASVMTRFEAYCIETFSDPADLPAVKPPAPVPYGFGFERVDVLTAAGYYADPAREEAGLDPVEFLS